MAFWHGNRPISQQTYVNKLDIGISGVSNSLGTPRTTKVSPSVSLRHFRNRVRNIRISFRIYSRYPSRYILCNIPCIVVPAQVDGTAQSVR